MTDKKQDDDLPTRLRERHNYLYKNSSVGSCMTEAADRLDLLENEIAFLQAKLKALETQEPVAFICQVLYGAGSRILRWQEPTQSGTLVNAGTIEPLYAKAKA